MLAPYTATGHNLGLDQRYRMMQAVIKTLAYSMIFNYPLTAREIEQYLVAELQIDDSIQQLLDDQRIKREGKYYYLAGFECSVVQREKRKSIATAKRAVLKRFLALA